MGRSVIPRGLSNYILPHWAKAGSPPDPCLIDRIKGVYYKPSLPLKLSLAHYFVSVEAGRSVCMRQKEVKIKVDSGRVTVGNHRIGLVIYKYEVRLQYQYDWHKNNRQRYQSSKKGEQCILI